MAQTPQSATSDGETLGLKKESNQESKKSRKGACFVMSSEKKYMSKTVGKVEEAERGKEQNADGVSRLWRPLPPPFQ